MRLASAGGVVVPGAGVGRLVQALALGGYDVVEQAFSDAWALGRDDFALELLEATPDDTLSRVVQAPQGRRLLAWLFIELTGDYRPQAERGLLPAMRAPRVDTRVGVAKEGIQGTRYVDQLVVDMATVRSGKPHVEAFSCKSRSFEGVGDKEMAALVKADGKEALTKYGGYVDVRRPKHPLFGRKVEVTKVHLVYEARLIDPTLRKTIVEVGARLRVEVHFQ